MVSWSWRSIKLLLLHLVGVPYYFTYNDDARSHTNQILEYVCVRLPDYLLTYSMEQSSSWEPNRFSASQEITRILWNPKVHYHTHKCPLPVPILTQTVHSLPSYNTSWRSVRILSLHLRLGLPSGLFSSGFPTKTLNTPLLSPIPATYSAHLILLDLIARTILGEEYRSLSSSDYTVP
jgi:hypothetical protein